MARQRKKNLLAEMYSPQTQEHIRETISSYPDAYKKKIRAVFKRSDVKDMLLQYTDHAQQRVAIQLGVAIIFASRYVNSYIEELAKEEISKKINNVTDSHDLVSLLSTIRGEIILREASTPTQEINEIYTNSAGIQFSITGASCTGKVREHNEDRIGYRNGICVVADGMGGLAAGDIASKTTVDTILASQASELEERIREANQAVFAHMRAYRKTKRMGSTVVALDLNTGTVIYLGDSRLYEVDYRNGTARRVTSDHNLLEIRMRQQENNRQRRENYNNGEGANTLTEYIGGRKIASYEDMASDVVPFDTNQIYLLCSDGFYQKIDPVGREDIFDEKGPNKIGALVKSYYDAVLSEREIVRKLCEYANERGGSDNISIVLVRSTENTETLSR